MLTTPEQKFLREYKPLLQMPKWKFILIYGLSWTFLVMLLMTAYEFFFERDRFTAKNLLVNLLIYPLGGVLYGWTMHWFFSEKLRKIEKKRLKV